MLEPIVLLGIAIWHIRRRRRTGGAKRPPGPIG